MVKIALTSEPNEPERAAEPRLEPALPEAPEPGAKPLPRTANEPDACQRGPHMPRKSLTQARSA
jgi:hypothetical protein